MVLLAKGMGMRVLQSYFKEELSKPGSTDATDPYICLYTGIHMIHN